MTLFIVSFETLNSLFTKKLQNLKVNFFWKYGGKKNIKHTRYILSMFFQCLFELRQ